MIRTKILPWMLHNANSDTFFFKNKFYPIKKRVLEKHGEMVGVDYQHILKTCYKCKGTGEFWRIVDVDGRSDYDVDYCWGCAGSGTYDEFWVKLLKYQFGNYSFHIPEGGKQYSKPDDEAMAGKNLIKGYIEHKHPRFHLDVECHFWLLLFYDRKSFFKLMGKIGAGSKRLTPMVILSSIIMNVRNIPCKFRVWRLLRSERKRITASEDVLNYDDVPF